MNASIITIGDEILVGQTVDTNSTWIASELNLIGISIKEIISISDKKEAIIEALNRELNLSELVILTGGLGPTQDDITKQVLTDYFDDELKMNQDVLSRIEKYFSAINRPILDVNKYQAMLPSKARIILNDMGTASGMWFEKDGSQIISLPGVPYEMKGLLSKAIPDLKLKFQIANFYHRTILLQGIGETTLATNISKLETDCRQKGIEVAYLPSTGLLKLRLTGNEEQKHYIQSALDKINSNYPELVYGFEEDSLESVIGEILRANKKTLGTVESCTGGSIASRIVSVSGSSDYFMGSIIAYDNRIKEQVVGISKSTIEKNGAVSQETVEQMAKNGIVKLGIDYCIATSGIAGPSGGTDEKPVGTIWIAIASKDEVLSKKFFFKQNRERNIESTVVYALNFLRRFILKIQ